VPKKRKRAEKVDGRKGREGYKEVRRGYARRGQARQGEVR